MSNMVQAMAKYADSIKKWNGLVEKYNDSKKTAKPKKKISENMRKVLKKAYKREAPKKKISPGIASAIKKIQHAQEKSSNCMKYIMKEARDTYKNKGAEEKAKLRKLWGESMKDAFSAVKSMRDSGALKCTMGRKKGQKNKKKKSDK